VKNKRRLAKQLSKGGRRGETFVKNQTYEWRGRLKLGQEKNALRGEELITSEGSKGMGSVNRKTALKGLP